MRPPISLASVLAAAALAVAPAVASAAEPAAAAATTPTPRQPLAGYANGSFFLRDPHDWFVLFPKGRLQVDWYNFLNRGDAPAGVVPNSSADPRPKDTIFVRRARVELQGTFLGHFDFHIGGEFTSTPLAGQNGALADAFVVVDYFSFLKLQAGQYDAPFSLENRTSDKYLDFMERSAPVRYLAVPFNKEQGAMLWGWLPRAVAYYSIGLFDGDGQNFRNQDNRPAILGRAFVAPLAWMPAAARRPWLRELEVGGSFWWQQATNLGGAIAGAAGATQNDRPALATEGGFSFFTSNYDVAADALGNPIREHLVPDRDQLKWGLELRVPIWKWGLQSELIHVREHLASYYDAVNVPNAATGRWSGAGFSRSGPQRGGVLDGYGWYIEAFAWILGDVDMLEMPGVEPLPRMKTFVAAPAPRWGLRALVRYEHVGVLVSGLPAVEGNADPGAGTYELHTLAVGLDGWGTRHVRVTANYLMNYIDGSAPRVRANFFFRRPEHELLFRLAVNL